MQIMDYGCLQVFKLGLIDKGCSDGPNEFTYCSTIAGAGTLKWTFIYF